MNNPTVRKRFAKFNDDEIFRMVKEEFLSAYKNPTRRGHEREIDMWAYWCGVNKLHVFFDVKRTHIERYGKELDEIRGLKRSTIAHKLCVISLFYRYCAEEDHIPKNPAANVRRPKVEYITTSQHLNDGELRRFLASVSNSRDPRDGAICKLLICNGLRVSEALNADIEDLGYEGHHYTLRIIRKGGAERLIPLSPIVSSAIQNYIGDRVCGPIFLGAEGERMNRHAVSRIVKRHCRKIGVHKRISPHSLRHSAITALFNNGIATRDVQNFAGHKDPRTTSYYDHGRTGLDSNPTYVLASLISGG